MFDGADITLPEVFAGHARLRPGKSALVCGTETLDWGGFGAAMNRVANALIADGVRKGDRVAVLVSSSIAACVTMFGTVRSGAAMVPVSTMLTPEQVRTVLADCAASHVICSGDLRHLVDPIAASLPALRRRIGSDFADDGWTLLDSLCAGVGGGEPDVTITGSDVFSIMYSSGTTGAPKGVVHTHTARSYFAISNGFEMKFDVEARGLVTTALYTAGTWLVVVPTLFVGGTLHIDSRFDCARFMQALDRERITHTFVVPSQLRGLMSEGLLDNCDLPDLKVLLSAGSPLRPQEKARLIGGIGRRFFELYGFTEGGSTLLRPEDQDARALSVGRPLLGQEARIVSRDGAPCGLDMPGEIACRGPGLLREYLGRPDETAAAIWRDDHGRAFVRSGDIGRMDADGFLYLLDRKKDMIISGGLNIFPADLESVLGEHPDVADVCVIGVDHDKWGETPLGVVVARDTATLDTDALLGWANKRLAKHQRLSAVVLRAALPRNALGKVLKRELREEYSADAD